MPAPTVEIRAVLNVGATLDFFIDRREVLDYSVFTLAIR